MFRTHCLVVAAVALLGAVGAFLAPVVLPDLKLLDLQWAALKPAGTIREEAVVVIGIDERSVAARAEPLALWHRQFGELLLGLREAKPRLVAFDVALPDRSYDAVAPDLDVALVRGLVSTRSAFPTFLALTVDESRTPRTIHPAFVAAAGTRPALALWPVDPDGIVRRFDERLGERGDAVPTFAGEIARAAGARSLPSGYVDFSLGAPFAYVPFADVLDAKARGDSAWLERAFAGRIVLVGSTLKFSDTVRVPVQLSGWGALADETPGVLLQAQAVRSLLANRIVPPAPGWVVALVAAASALLALLVRNGRARLVMGVLIVAALGSISHGLLRAGVYLPIAWAAGCGLLALALAHGIDVARSLAERSRLRRSFAGYVSPEVMAQIVEGRIQPEASGELREVCALFSDMRSFTTRSESMTPQQCIAFLNRYFEGVVDIIHARGGTVVSFAGDGIMAIFGAPQDLPNPCEAGYQAAREMLGYLERYNDRLAAEGVERLAIGIGLHFGPAAVGHVGSRLRHDYTAIGDVINVASRLEGATKEAGYEVVCSREVAERLPDRSELVPLNRVAIKGHAPVEAFGFSPEAPQDESSPTGHPQVVLLTATND